MLADLIHDLDTRVALRGCASIGRRVRVRGRICIRGSGAVYIGDDVELDGRAAPIELQTEALAVIRLEPGVRIESGVAIGAAECVHVGARSRLGGFCKIIDRHYHPLSGDRHAPGPPPVPVHIGTDCVLGWRAVLLPGAELGARVELWPGVVVSRRVPAGVVLAGSPPQVIKRGAGR